MKTLSVNSFFTPWGSVTVVASAEGLVRVILPGVASAKPGGKSPKEKGQGGSPSRRAEAHARRARREILEYLRGRRRAFTVPLDLATVPPFSRRILLAASRIPYGATVTYGGLARRADSPRAARAVGQVMARNPVPLLVPCHRVVASGGLGGFTGGLVLKRRLLALEGAQWPRTKKSRRKT